MNLPKCNLTRCTLRSQCQRFAEDGMMVPIMPFLPEGLFKSASLDEGTDIEKDVKSDFDATVYTGAVNGCADYWPVGTGVEWFEKNVSKTPVKA